MTIMNIIDHRKRPYRFLKINAVVEPTRHDNRVKDADQSAGTDNWIGYDEREHIPLADAIEWAATFPDEVTLFLYDEDGGLYEVQRRASGHDNQQLNEGENMSQLSEAQRKLDASVTEEQAREYVRKERERNAACDKPYPAPRDGFINDYD